MLHIEIKLRITLKTDNMMIPIMAEKLIKLILLEKMPIDRYNKYYHTNKNKKKKHDDYF